MVLIREVTGSQVKIPVSCMWSSSTSYWLGSPSTPKIAQAIAFALGYSPGLDGKMLLLKTLPILVAKQRNQSELGNV